MNSFLQNVGILTIEFLIIYIYKKILEWNDYRNSGFYEDEKVYRAADEFAHGSPSDEIKAILSDCLELDEEGIEKIMSLSLPYRNGKTGKYQAFIKAVNKVLGADIYDEKYEKHHKCAAGQ